MEVKRPESKQPMPPEAKRVFKGEVFDVYQWEQKMFDGSTATFEKLKRPDTVVVVPVTEDGRFVILDEEQPDKPKATNFPGGRIEEGEDPVQAAKRELLEETGYVPGGELELWYSTQPVSKIDWAVYVFVARGCRKTGEPKPDAGEKIEVMEMSLEEIFEAITKDHDRFEGMGTHFLSAKLLPEKMAELEKLFGV